MFQTVYGPGWNFRVKFMVTFDAVVANCVHSFKRSTIQLETPKNMNTKCPKNWV